MKTKRRRFATDAKTIDLNGSFKQWLEVGPEFADRAFDVDHRDFGEGARHYVNATGRNDIVAAKVARDESSIYFYGRTREPLTLVSDPNWIWLLLDIDQNRNIGWEGYDFLINRSPDGKSTWLERSVDNRGTWERVAKLDLRVTGNELMLAVPSVALGLPNAAAVTFDFKWWDNPQKRGDIMDVYLSRRCRARCPFQLPDTNKTQWRK